MGNIRLSLVVIYGAACKEKCLQSLSYASTSMIQHHDQKQFIKQMVYLGYASTLQSIP